MVKDLKLQNHCFYR